MNGDRSTREADVFSFGMIVIEVSLWPSLCQVFGTKDE